MRRVTEALGAWLPILAFLGGGLGPAAGAAPSPDQLRLRAAPEAGTAIRLIGQLWDSGFFHACPAVRDEICNNEYAFFDPRSPLAALQKQGMACFAQGPGPNNTIYLREDIFCHYNVGLEGVLKRRAVESTALKVLVHELCHDFWTNILDGRDRALFAMDGAEFIAAYRLAMTPGEKREFLRRAGQRCRDSELTPLYADLDALIASYPPGLLYGPELFAWFGEQVFSAGLNIPPAFCKYYSGLISTRRPPPRPYISRRARTERAGA